MDKERLKLIVKNLELLVESLKSEVYSDKDSYTKKCIEDTGVYKSVLKTMMVIPTNEQNKGTCKVA